MGYTVEQIIKSSLRKIGAMNSAGTMTAAEQATNLMAYNLMLVQWSGKNWISGFTAPTDVSTDSALTDSEVNAVTNNLAIVLAPEYNRKVSAEVVEAAKDSLDIIRDIRLTAATVETDIAVSGAYRRRPNILAG